MVPSPSFTLPQETPLYRRRYRRVALLWSAAVGLLVPLYFLGIADASHLGWDFRAYHAAARAVLHGEPFVGIDPGVPGVSYVYPPISVVLFLPQGAVGNWRVGFALQSVLNAGAALALAALVVHTVESHRGRLPATDRLLVAGFCLGSAPALAVLGLGQVDALVALALGGAFVALERERGGLAGVAVGGAALVKVFPIALGLWLAWRRAWRALGAAVATGVAGLAMGALWFGLDAYRRYLGVLAERSRVAEFAGTVSADFFAMSLSRPLSQALPGVDPHLYAPLGALLVAPAAVLVAGRERRSDVTDRLATYLVAVASVLLVSPASNVLYVVYVYFPLLCLLYLDTSRRGRSLLLAGTAAIAFPVQPGHVGAALTAAGAPVALSASVAAAAREVLTVVSVPLVGLLAILAWCSLRTVRGRRTPTVDVRAEGAD